MPTAVTCVYVEGFEKLYDTFCTQRKLEAGKVLAALREVKHVAVVGRKYRDPEPDKDLGEGIELRCDDGNPVDPDAVAVYRDGVHIGFVPRDTAPLVRQWMKTSRAFVNSPKSIYVLPSRALF